LPASELKDAYNSKRTSKIKPSRFKPLKVGDSIRLVTKKPKGDYGYKSYKATQYSKQSYKIEKVSKTKPVKYFVAKRWRNQGEISFKELGPVDEVSDKMLENRTQYGNPKQKPKPAPKAKKAPAVGGIGARVKQGKKELKKVEELKKRAAKRKAEIKKLSLAARLKLKMKK
jgi:hypothetical protein